MAVPPNPDPSPAHSSTHTNCRYMKCRVTTVHPARHSCASDQSSAPEQQETQAWTLEASLSFNNQGLQMAIPLLLLCAPRCCHFCLCSEIRKAASTCREITVLLISGSSTSLYTCFPGSKCLCFWDRKYFMIFVQKQPIISKLKLQSLASISSVFFHWEV